MELLELIMIGPILYLVLRLTIKEWNRSVDSAYNDAQLKASCLLGLGQKVEAMQVMDKALSDYKRFRIRKVLGVKFN